MTTFANVPATGVCLAVERIATEIGVLLVLTDERHCLRAVDWEDRETRMRRLLSAQYACELEFEDARHPTASGDALKRYFHGELHALDDLATETRGTAFQRRVWAALRTIPTGETATYGALAQQLDCPGAARAVGAANGANPIPIVVPCHRVIGAGGVLTGYGGGIERKRWLLEHEGVRLSAARQQPLPL